MTKASFEALSPIVHSFSVGSRNGWILRDGTYQFPAAALARGASATELAVQLGDDISAEGNLEMSVNGMLLSWGNELVLVDAGAGSAYGATLGQMEKSLRAAGFEPSDVTAVVFTHLHLDHIAGAIDYATQTFRFPRARFLARREEAEFWNRPEPDLTETGVPPEQCATMIHGIRETLTLFGKRLEFFSAKDVLFEGLTAVPLSGHTPFHTGFLLCADGESLLCLGDAMTVPRLHVAHPEWAPVGDAQPKVAEETRRLIGEWAVRERLRLFGYHFPFPGLGRIHCAVSENDQSLAQLQSELIFKSDQ